MLLQRLRDRGALISDINGNNISTIFIHSAIVVKIGRNAAELSSGALMKLSRLFRGLVVTNSCRNAARRSLMLRKSKLAQYFHSMHYGVS